MRISVKLSPSIEPIPPDVLSPRTNIIRCELSLAYRSIASRHGPNDDPLTTRRRISCFAPAEH